MSLLKKDTIDFPNLKAIEQMLWRSVQQVFSEAFAKILEEIDQQIAENRDKKRFRLISKRKISFGSLFGEVTFKRNYYKDRETGEYIHLLDRYLEFEELGEFSPMVEEAAIQLAIDGPSYRKAAKALETFLGYNVISHETIRQHLLQSECIPRDKEPVSGRVLFVEVDGLYIKRQGKRKKGKEEKIAAVHQGWERSGKRSRMKNKRHFVYKGTLPFWEEFEQFLVEHFEYDPLYHKLVINGDGAEWITSCREYFKNRAFYCIDRYHVAVQIQSIFREHPRYYEIRKALASFNGQQLLLELNSAVGTLGDPKKEQDLEHLIRQLEKYPEALGDYREWLKEQGIDTTGMRPMGSAEATMRVFAQRLKNGRSWVDEGLDAMMTGLVASLDRMELKTVFGRVKHWINETNEENPPRFYLERISKTVGKVTRDNIAYLKGKANTPIYRALKALAGF